MLSLSRAIRLLTHTSCSWRQRLPVAAAARSAHAAGLEAAPRGPAAALLESRLPGTPCPDARLCRPPPRVRCRWGTGPLANGPRKQKRTMAESRQRAEAAMCVGRRSNELSPSVLSAAAVTGGCTGKAAASAGAAGAALVAADGTGGSTDTGSSRALRTSSSHGTLRDSAAYLK